MAVIVNQNDSTNSNNPGAGNTSGQAGSVAPVGASGAAPGSVTPVGGNAAPSPSSSGQFTNLQKYISANQGAGQNMANAIGNKTQNQANNVNNEINQGNTMIGSQLDAEKNRIAQSSGFAQQVGTDPTQLTSDPNKLAAFQQLYSGANNGQNIQNAAQGAFGNAATDISNLQNTAAQAGTEQGRFGLLQQTLGRPTYSSGQQGLDQLLMQSGGGNNTLTQLQQKLGQQANLANTNLNADQSAIGQALSGINTSAAGAQNLLKNSVGTLDPNDSGAYTVDTNGNPIKSNGTGALGQLQQALYQNQQGLIGQGTAQQKSLQAALANPSGMTAADIAALNAAAPGLNLTQGEHIYNTDLSQYLNPTFNPGTISEQSVANANDLAKYNALNQLSGGVGGYLTSQNIGGAPGIGNTNQLVSLGNNAGNLQSAIAGETTQFNSLAGQANPNIQNIVNGINLDRSRSLSGAGASAELGVQSILQNVANSNDPNAIANAITQIQSNPTLNNWVNQTLAIQSNGGSGGFGAANVPGYQGSLGGLMSWLSNYNSMNPNLVVGGPNLNQIQHPVAR